MQLLITKSLKYYDPIGKKNKRNVIFTGKCPEKIENSIPAVMGFCQ
jgi:hypothetical protein